MSHDGAAERRGWLVVEPHFDDACFSYAGTMLAEGPLFQSLCVLTMFSRSPYTADGYTVPAANRSLAETVSALRQAEGTKFAAAVRAESRAGGLPEALLRGYATPAAFPRPEDRLQYRIRIQDIVRALLAERQVDRLSFPLGSANHVDHTLVADSLLDLVMEASAQFSRSNIVLYREAPYALDDPSGVSARVAHIEQEWPVILCPLYRDISCFMDQKLRLASLFASQLSDELSKIDAIDRRDATVGIRHCELGWSVTLR